MKRSPDCDNVRNRTTDLRFRAPIELRSRNFFLVTMMLVLYLRLAILYSQEPETDDNPKLPPNTALAFEGSVVDEFGKPVSGVRVVARRQGRRNSFEDYLYFGEKHKEFDENLADGLTDRNGRFRLSIKDSNPSLPLTILAYQNGYSPGTAVWNGRNSVAIQLHSGVTIRGSVVDENDRPIKTARIRLMSWFTYENNRSALARPRSEIELEGHLVGDTIGIETQSTGDGSYRLGNLPPDRWAVLSIDGDGYLPRCAVVDTGSDPALETAGDALRIFDGGVVRLKRATRIQLAAVAKDSRLAVPIKDAFASYKPWLQTSDPLTERAKKLEVRGNLAIVPILPPRELRVWLIPDPSSGYLASMVDVDGTVTADGDRQIEVELQAGARVFGRVVDDRTNQPIEGVSIHYESESIDKLLDFGASVPSVKSDKSGEFAMIVPEINGWLRQIGRVDGYRSIYDDYNHDVRTIAPSKKISPTVQHETRVEFRLMPATRVKGQVVDSQGRPVAYAQFAAGERVTQSGYRVSLGTTDEQGRFELRNIFAELLLVPPTGNSPNANESATETIFFWSSDRRLTATVKVPYPHESEEDFELKVLLSPASSISGRVVDQQTGAGVGSVDVGLTYFPGPMSSAFSAFGTQSDQDGNFTIGPIFAESSVKLVFQGEYLGYREAEDAALTVRPGAEYSIGEIPLLVYRDLDKLLELPDVSKLTTIEAVNALQAALARVRARISEIQQWQSGQSSTDSISIAEVTAAERFGEAFLKLSQRTSDPDLAFQILTEYLKHVDSSMAPSFYVGRAKTAFLERYLEREDVMDVLPSILPQDDVKSWRYVYDRSKNDAAKSLACQHLIHNSLSEFYFLATWEGYSDKQFTDRLAEARQLWKFAYRESANQLSNGPTLKQFVDGRLRQTLRQLQSTSAPNPVRLDKLRRSIEEQLAE